MNKEHSIEGTIPIIEPVQPETATDHAIMVGLLRDKVNEIIGVTNILRDEVIRIKKKLRLIKSLIGDIDD